MQFLTEISMVQSFFSELLIFIHVFRISLCLSTVLVSLFLQTLLVNILMYNISVVLYFVVKEINEQLPKNYLSCNMENMTLTVILFLHYHWIQYSACTIMNMNGLYMFINYWPSILLWCSIGFTLNALYIYITCYSARQTLCVVIATVFEHTSNL